MVRPNEGMRDPQPVHGRFHETTYCDFRVLQRRAARGAERVMSATDRLQVGRRADGHVRRPGGQLANARSLGARRRGAGRRARVSAGAVPLPLLLPGRGLRRTSSSPSPCRGRPPSASRRSRRELDVTIVASSVRGARAGAVSTTPRRWSTATHGYVGKYRKMHIPDDPRYYEKFYFTPGDLGFKALPGAERSSACWCAGTSGIRKPRA